MHSAVNREDQGSNPCFPASAMGERSGALKSLLSFVFKDIRVQIPSVASDTGIP